MPTKAELFIATHKSVGSQMETKENILTKKYEVGRLLGKGTFAKVYYGRNVETGQGVAVKVIDKGKILRGGLVDQTKREISVMRMVKHQNIVQLYEVMATKTKIYFVIEYAKGGELFHKVSKSRLDEDVARKYFQQLMCAVSFCHTRGVHHRDLKPENLLLDESGTTLKVSDFGLSALPESKRKDGLLHTTCGTPAYVAPEVISRRGYDGAKADIWSCGVILFVLLAGYLPFYEPNVVEMYKKISSAEYKFPSWFPYDVRRLISRILDPNPKTRISIAKIMSHPWFRKGFDDDPLPKDIAAPKIKSDESIKPNSLNAFDIISLSSGFDLSGLFVSSDQKDEMQFSSTKSVREIVSRFEEICCFLSLRVTNKDGVGSMRLESLGRMEMDVSIFEASSSFHLVEVKRCGGGDSYEYHRLMRRDFRPALRDIVWAWH